MMLRDVLLIRGGQVFDGEALLPGDVLVRDGRIEAVGRGLSAPKDAAMLEAAGCIVSPGFCDLHVHLRQPGFENKETIATGTAAAAAGGYTTVCAMPNLVPVPDSIEALRLQLEAIEADAAVRVLPYAAITAGQQGQSLVDVQRLAPFVCGFSDDGRGVQDGGMMRAALAACAANGSFVAAHCEDESLISRGSVTVHEGCGFAQRQGYRGVSNQSEWSEVARDIELARQTGGRLHICHTSTAKSFELVRAAKAEGLQVSCEATPHNLLLCCDDIAEDDGRYKMNPPLRDAEDRNAALAALADGTIDAIATDHAPHTEEEKAGGFARAMNGVVGLETAFAVLYTRLVQMGHISARRLLTLFTSGPYAILGEAPRLRPGQPASLTVLDVESRRPVQPKEFLSKGRATPFEGWQLAGWPVLTLFDGKEVYKK